MQATTLDSRSGFFRYVSSPVLCGNARAENSTDGAETLIIIQVVNTIDVA